MNTDTKTSLRGTCDLHTHTNFSDGSLTPTALVELACEAGLSALALTDHNTIDGLPYFLRAGEGRPIRLIPGVELSTEWREIEIHVLALDVKESDYPAIRALVGEMREGKRAAAEGMINDLIADGYALDRERLSAGAMGQINRAHIAMELMRCGYVSTREEAFDTLVSKHSKYYHRTRMLDTVSAVSFIKSIGATAVLAHPLLNVTADQLRELLSELCPAGLDAMEVLYSEYDESQTALSRELVNQFGILPSGGSDFHGKNKPDIRIGCGKGNLRIPIEFAENMKLI